jgi:signal transduction histidine kinase
VADTGSGIPADILPHVLEPFFTTKRGKGTGLGLSISHAYARSHGGDIKVESIPERGTTVRIVLPIRQEKIENQPEPETSGDLVIG